MSQQNHFYFIFNNRRLLLTNKLEFPRLKDDFLKGCQLQNHLTFKHKGNFYSTAKIPSDINLPNNLQLTDLRELYFCLPLKIVELVIKARQLLEWNKLHQYCGECGTKTKISEFEYCRICENPNCGQMFYPKLVPVVIVAVEKDDKILLARSPHFPPEIYSVLAGFIEAGENAEEAVKREVMEETGIEIDNIRYFASQAWPNPSELILGFQANYKSGEVACNKNELEDANFFDVNSMPKIFPGNFTVSQWLMTDFKNRNRKAKL